jgi:hypothetical protein
MNVVRDFLPGDHIVKQTPKGKRRVLEVMDPVRTPNGKLRLMVVEPPFHNVVTTWWRYRDGDPWLPRHHHYEPRISVRSIGG